MTPFLFGPPGHRLYGVYHAPASASKAATQVLVCPPFGQEAVRVHRLNRLLAEQLARQGMHVMRFDYHGTGESSGQDEDGSPSAWRDDILLAHEELSLRTRATRTVWFGARLGGTLAMMASALAQPAPHRLVLWEPVLDGHRYLQELGEAHAQQTFEPLMQAKAHSADIRDEVIGFGVSPDWVREIGAISMQQLAPAPSAEGVLVCERHEGLAAQLSAQQAARSRNWQAVPTPGMSIAWHVEEANGAALAPPALLQVLIASIKGEAA
jgi:pimeloyl-ACP methyl ester carboxylesterase